MSDDLVRARLLRRGFALEYVTLGWNVAGLVVLAVRPVPTGRGCAARSSRSWTHSWTASSAAAAPVSSCAARPRTW